MSNERFTKNSFNFLHTALIIIDMQNDFLLEDAPICCAGGLGIVKNIEKLARYFRANNQPIIFTQEEHRKQKVDFGLELDYEEPEHCLEGTYGVDFYRDLKPHENDYLIKKRRYSAFFATDLDLLLRGLDINTLILVGVATDVCVRATAQDAQQLGYYVIVIPECVADLTFGLLLDISRQISYTNKIVHLGKWQTAIGSDITGKTLGILGLGAIGKSVAQRATGFKMNIIAFDPYISNSKLEKEFEYISLCSLDSVLQESDFLSIHVPLTEETKNLLSEKNLLKMKKGSYIINTAKGEVIDENALYKLLKSGHLSGAAMDVCTIEPIPPFHPLLELDNVVITPHIGVYTKEAISEVSLTCAKYIVETLTHINL